ncbi:MAG TPA: heparan-alpha-glucosaminide N-acetyltransferase domain-containing protein [Vicinamibacterales bacterium]
MPIGTVAPEQVLPRAAPPLRVRSIDIVRGAVMVLMALDHVRDWVTSVRFQPEDLARSSAALFATRWVTHFCAPTFFFLAGIGIGLARSKESGSGRADGLARFLIARGVWLLVLELVITPIGWQFGFQLIPAFALVLWALAWSMMAMALLIRVRPDVLAALALAMIGGHNLFDSIRADGSGVPAILWRVLHVPGFAIPGVLFTAYPLVPWVAVMALGSVAAAAYQWPAERRRRVLISSGAAAITAFLALRALNGYGNPAPWAHQRTAALTVASFFNTLKYPPSLDYLLMTLGPMLIVLALVEQARGPVARWLSVYGRVPLFFYVVHIFVAHAIAVLLAFAQSGAPRRIPVVTDPGAIPPWYGVALPGVYLAWAMVVALMYYPCRRMATLKNARRDWWLRYL